MPKGRVGEDGKRFYTRQDVDFILREWQTQTTGRFLMYTLPLILVMGFLIILTIVEVRDKIDEMRVAPTPTVPWGFGAPPQIYYAPDQPVPTPSPVVLSTPVYESIEKYREQVKQMNSNREQGRSQPRDENLYSPFGE